MKKINTKSFLNSSTLLKGIIGAPSAFTLVEIMVSITIFSIMMISIVSIYITSIDINAKSDINRMMQENIKNIVSQISEDVIKNGIEGVSSSVGDSCTFSIGSNYYKEGTSLCTSSLNKYYIAKKIGYGSYNRVTNIANCSSVLDKCILVKHDSSGNISPLTNSFVSVKDLNFYVSNTEIPKVTLNIVLRPAINKGVKSTLIEKNELIFQTTITQRPF